MAIRRLVPALRLAIVAPNMVIVAIAQLTALIITAVSRHLASAHTRMFQSVEMAVVETGKHARVVNSAIVARVTDIVALRMLTAYLQTVAR